jgi:cytochrome b6-f complex iron-sulfur subunit
MSDQPLDAHHALSSESIGEVSRREFLKAFTMGSAVLACGSALATLAASCSGNASDSPTQAPLTGAREQITLANVPQLQTVGGFLRRAFPRRNNGREVLIVRVAQSGADAFRTASVVCTHLQCNVENPQGASATCLCHGSRFSVSGSNFGAVLNGPATSPLQTFPTSFDGTVITISF